MSVFITGFISGVNTNRGGFLAVFWASTPVQRQRYQMSLFNQSRAQVQSGNQVRETSWLLEANVLVAQAVLQNTSEICRDSINRWSKSHWGSSTCTIEHVATCFRGFIFVKKNNIQSLVLTRFYCPWIWSVVSQPVVSQHSPELIAVGNHECLSRIT